LFDDVEGGAAKALAENQILALGLRERFMRDALSVSVKHDGARQVLILGSGYDTRAVRKKKYSDNYQVRFFEVDKANVLAYKKEVFEAHYTDPNAKYIPMDYVQENMIGILKNAGIDFNQPTHVIWEGNTMYLKKPDALKVLKQLATHIKKLSISFDYLHPEVLSGELSTEETSSMLTEFEDVGAKMVNGFSPDEIENIAHSLGLTVKTNYTCSKLARNYSVDKQPYVTEETYSMCTLSKSS